MIVLNRNKAVYSRFGLTLIHITTRESGRNRYRFLSTNGMIHSTKAISLNEAYSIIEKRLV
jgi:hypothetical protein